MKDQRLRTAIIEVVKTQLRDNNPPATRQTFQRLQNEGFSEQEALKLIGYVVASEVFEVMKEGRRYDEERYIQALNVLPEPPWNKDR